MNEPKVPMYSTAISQVWGRIGTTSQLGAGGGVERPWPRLSMKNQAAHGREEQGSADTQAGRRSRYMLALADLSPAGAAPTTSTGHEQLR